MRWIDIRRQLVPAAAFVALSALALHLFAYNLADSDLFWHVRYGQAVLRDGKLPLWDDASYTASIPFMNHEWGASVLYAWIERWGGFEALLWPKVAIGLGMSLLLAWEVLRTRPSIVVFVLSAVLYLMTVRAGFSVRAQNFSYLCFALMLLVHRRIVTGRSSRRVWWALLLPPLYGVWANLHGGVIVGGVLALLWVAAVFDARRDSPSSGLPALQGADARGASYVDAVLLPLSRRERGIYLVCVIAAAFATCLTPWGVDGMVTLVRHVLTHDRPGNYEFAALSWWPPEYWQANLTLVVAAGVIIATPLRRRLDDVVVLGFAALITQLAQRNGPFLAIAAFVVLPPHLDALRTRLRGTREEPPPVPVLAEITAVLLVAIAAGLVWLNAPRLKQGLEVRADAYPVSIVRWMDAHRIRGNLAVFMNWGGYVLYALAPAVKVSGDGRYEWVYSEQVVADNWAFASGGPGAERLLTAYPTDLALVSLAYPEALEAMSKVAGWREVCRAGPGSLWAREGFPAPEGGWQCP